MTSSQIIQTQILWEVCTDEPGFPFDPDGLLSENKQEILERLHRLRMTRPDAYLVKHVVTRCNAEEEQMSEGATNCGFPISAQRPAIQRRILNNMNRTAFRESDFPS